MAMRAIDVVLIFLVGCVTLGVIRIVLISRARSKLGRSDSGSPVDAGSPFPASPHPLYPPGLTSESGNGFAPHLMSDASERLD